MTIKTLAVSTNNALMLIAESRQNAWYVLPPMNTPTGVGFHPKPRLKNRGTPISNHTSREAKRKNRAAESVLT